MEIQEILKKAYMWMFVGLMVTFGIAYYVAGNENMLYNIYDGGLMFPIIIAEIVLVIFLVAKIRTMKEQTAKMAFLAYSALTGLTFSVIFVAYEMESIINVFGITAILFFILATVAPKLNMDLRKMGTFLFVTLLGIIIASVVNIFIGSTTFDLVLTVLGVVIFMIYIAFDVKKIIALAAEGSIPAENLAIYGALELYLDFVNLFIRLLQLFGSRD